MAQLAVTETVEVSYERAWALASDLSRYGEWLSLHDGWRGDLPDELGLGTEVTGVVRAKGIRNRVTWVVTDYRPPASIVLEGRGKGGTRAALRFALTPRGDRTDLAFVADFSHPALIGPMGSAMARTLRGDLHASIERFVALA